MLRLLVLLNFLWIFLTATAYAAEMVNVEYIHLLIEQKWGVNIPYNPSVTNPKVAANMEYLLGMVDITNKWLNGMATTDYLHSKYATKQAADTVATIEATDRLIKIEPKFFVTTTGDTVEFKFYMSAAGTFQIYWGDGKTEIIKRTTTDETEYSHTYAEPGEHKIGLGGYTTAYSTTGNVAAISFSDSCINVAEIDGALGAVFGTLGTAAAQQPKFAYTFKGCTNLTDIPAGLFTGVSGKGGRMFFGTFLGCNGLKSIPAGLFADIYGAGSYMFSGTFSGCSSLESVPSGLFAGVAGSNSGTFLETFSYCKKLKNIPSDLFVNVSGGGGSMFSGTFNSCHSLESIPEDLFAGVTKAYGTMFYITFSGTAVKSIPAGLFANVEGAASRMFEQTFHNCSELTSIPENLFPNVEGTAHAMFFETFGNCKKLTGCIPPQMFAGLETDDLIAQLQTWETFKATGVAYEMCPVSEE